MKKLLILLLSISTLYNSLLSQTYKDYNPSATIDNELEHTKLKVSFNFEKEEMYGEEWLTARPFAYSQDSLILNAKGMLIHEVKLNNKKLDYTYNDNNTLRIKLNKTYKKGESYIIYIKYTAIPSQVTQEGSEAITEAKGLYFINPRQEENIPTQIWTQGETQSSSCWFPTIDETNQKTTQEIYMIVPDKYVTLSNGILISQVKNNDGTRTDYWKMDQKHSPYLFFMGIGDFAIVKDKWKEITVDYYVDKAYEPYAKQIFGHTPEMIQYFSDLLKYPYPWKKYAQMTARNYVSGAMENTTATLHSDDAQQSEGQLIDENMWEHVIAHELFHHWFGDLVTAESWSNLTVNESFANYSEYLWLNYKYGLDEAEQHKYSEKSGYLFDPYKNEKDLVRFNYKNREDVFDGITYNKGGLILHMLRNYLGDEVFFAGLNLYLTKNAYKSAEAHELRLSLEKVSGKDLNWFFNQWYYGAGNPNLDVNYTIDEVNKKVKINIKQIQEYIKQTTKERKFQFPLAIDIYEEKKPIRYNVWVASEDSVSFEFTYKKKPQLININPDDLLLCEYTDNKTTEQYIFQYKNAKEYYSKRVAIENLSNIQTDNKEVLATLLEATHDPSSFYGLRKLAINKLDVSSKEIAEQSEKILAKIAKNDSDTRVRGEAYKKLTKINPKKYLPDFIKASQEKSYAIKSAAILGILESDPQKASEIINTITDPEPKGELLQTIVLVAIKTIDMDKSPLVGKMLLNSMLSATAEEDIMATSLYYQKLMAGDYNEGTKNFIDFIVKIYPQIKDYPIAPSIIDLVQESLKIKEKSANTNSQNKSLKNQVDYIKKGLEKLK